VVEFPIAAGGALSLKAMAAARFPHIGGRLMKSGADVRVVRALDGISLHLKTGDRLGLYGPNGAGKTTLLRSLAGVYAPTAGRLQIDGTLLPLFDIGVGLDGESTGYENIYIRGLVMGIDEAEIKAKTASIAEFSELGAYLDLPVRTYSSGMMLRLLFSIATSVDGDIILMDEWLTVGDQAFKFKAQKRMIELTKDVGIMVLASHEKRLLREFCNLVLQLDGGRVQKFGPIDEVFGARD
jgi:ABC-2 type transport system ATP-binding protein/lipopolysaccharide transport system ATP-binding protein